AVRAAVAGPGRRPAAVGCGPGAARRDGVERRPLERGGMARPPGGLGFGAGRRPARGRATAVGPALLPPPCPPRRPARRRAGACPASAHPALTGRAPPAAAQERGAPSLRARL